MRTTGPLRFQSVANNPFGAINGSTNLVGSGEGSATGMITNFRLDNIVLPSDFPTDGNFTVRGFKIRTLTSFSAQGTQVTVKLTIGNNSTGGTGQLIQQFASGNVESTFGGPNNLLGFSTSTFTTQTNLEGLELHFTLTNGTGSNVTTFGDADTGPSGSTHGIVPSVEIFYTTDDLASTLNEVDLSVSPETIEYESFNEYGLGDFKGQSTTNGTNTASTSASSTTGWSPSNGGTEGDYTDWENGKDCVDLATSFFGAGYSGNSDGVWIDGPTDNPDSTTPQLTKRFVRGWGIDTGTTPSGGTGPYGGLSGSTSNNFANGATNASTTNKYLYTETSSSNNGLHHIFRTPQLTLSASPYSGSDKLFLEFWLYASGVSCGNLYIYASDDTEANHFSANLLATIYCFTNNSGSSSSSTATTVKTFARGLLRLDGGEQSTSTPFYTGSWNIISSTVTANNANYDTSYIRCRIPLHGDYNGTDMAAGDLRVVNAGRHCFFFVHQPHFGTTTAGLASIAASRTNSGGSGDNTNLSFTSFRGDMAIDQVALVKVDGGTEQIISINEVPAASFGDFNAIEIDPD